MRDATEQFRTAIHDAGLTPPEALKLTSSRIAWRVAVVDRWIAERDEAGQ